MDIMQNFERGLQFHRDKDCGNALTLYTDALDKLYKLMELADQGKGQYEAAVKQLTGDNLQNLNRVEKSLNPYSDIEAGIDLCGRQQYVDAMVQYKKAAVKLLRLVELAQKGLDRHREAETTRELAISLDNETYKALTRYHEAVLMDSDF